jgi:hypothetical protein
MRRDRMLKFGAIVATLPAVLLFLSVSQVAGDESHVIANAKIPKGLRAYGCKISKDLDVYDQYVQPRMKVDIVGEMTDPTQTGVALTNVIVVAIDSVQPIHPETRIVTLALTPVQCEVMALMKKHGIELAIKLRTKEKPKQ